MVYAVVSKTTRRKAVRVRVPLSALIKLYIMQHYTVGFIFNPSLTRVLLIHKTNPEWQRGKVNGIGGKNEKNEGKLDCIVREVKEETGLITKKNEWSLVGTMYSQDWENDVFALIYSGKESDAKSTDKEIVEWFDVNNLPQNAIDNVSWLVPLCLDKITHKTFETFSITYTPLKSY